MPDQEPVATEPPRDEKADKKKDKLRSAWISFIGRIVAQIVGAVATIVLGLAIAGRLPGRQAAPEAKAPASTGERGRPEEALQQARRAVELDPLSPLMHRTVAFVHYLARRFDEAELAARDVIQLDPRSPSSYFMLARVLNARGDHAGAIEACERVRSDERSDELLAMLGYAFAQAGQPARTRELLSRLKTRPRPLAPQHEGVLLIALGETDAAFAAFERALAQRSDYLLGLKMLPLLDPLRGDPRFAALVRKVGLAAS